jgi:cathepsin D
MLSSIIFVLALSLPFSEAAVPPRRSEPLHIPLIRRRSNVRRQGVDLDHYAAVSDAIRQKYGISSSGPSRRAQTTDIGITNQVRLSFTTDSGVPLTPFNTTRAPIQVTLLKSASALREFKNPMRMPSRLLSFDIILRAQKFNLVLDTGSSDLWFATTGCAGCSRNTPVLDPTKSSTLQQGTQRISLNYGSGSAAGLLVHDTITMGPFTVNPQTFGVYFPSLHFPFSPFPRVNWVFYSLLARVTTCPCEHGNRSAPRRSSVISCAVNAAQ